MNEPKFYLLIIGTEILNRRRVDKHFDYVSKVLLEGGHKLQGSFVIQDDPKLIIETINFISAQSNTVIFSFGGIGSTPDDYTRQCASSALSDGKLIQHEEATKIISSNVDTSKHPHALNMALLPSGAKLLKNIVNNMPAFYLNDRFFFMPGFPEMSHPMVTDIMTKFFPNRPKPHTRTLTALTKESTLIDVMKQLPQNIELSSLPKRYSDGYRTTIHLSSNDQKSLEHAFGLFTNKLDNEGINYSLDQD